MKKITALLLSALIAFACVGCGKKSNSGTNAANYNVTDILTAIEKAAPIENAMDMTNDDLVYSVGLDAESVEEFAGKTTNTNGAAGTILVIKAKAGTAEDIKTKLETYRNGTADFLANYEEFAAAKALAENGRVVVKGDYVVLAIGGSTDVEAEKAYEPIDAAINEAFK